MDIEWEFVNGNVRNEAVRQKLTEWCQNEHQCLTIAFCHDDQNRSFNEALGLPQTIYETGTPILCHLDESDIIRLTQTIEARFANSRNRCVAKEGTASLRCPLYMRTIKFGNLILLKSSCRR